MLLLNAYAVKTKLLQFSYLVDILHQPKYV